MDKLEKEYMGAYVENEANANRHMSYALLFTAGLLFLVLFGYLFKLFDVARHTYVMTVVIIPIVILLLCSPMIFIKSKRLSKPTYKYYVLSLFIFTIGVLNVIMPKHAVLGWAVCIGLTGHYYNPKVCRYCFIAVLVACVLCLTASVFYGEFDSNLLSGQLDKKAQLIHNFLLPDAYPDTATGRWNYIIDLMGAGDNRFLQIYTNYLVGRLLFLSLLYAVIFSLNKRTFVLLNREIQVNGEYQKSKTELEVAKDIQLNTLPSNMISAKEVEIIGELKAAKEVGGDLYDYLEIDEDHVAILIGDVSGKGVPAAMFMMKTITSFRDLATIGKTPSEILSEINRAILKGNKNQMFVTCFLAILDKTTGRLVYANAGHNPPVVGSKGNFHYLKASHGFLLGCLPECYAKDEEIMLAPNESITLYTDGITEARDVNGDFYGEERLLKTMNKKDYSCTVDIHYSIKSDLASFVGEAPQSDDITLLTLRYMGADYAVKDSEFDATKESIPGMLDLIEQFSEEHNFPTKFKHQILIVGDELFSNIVFHGYEGKGGRIYVRLLFKEKENEFVITIVDQAKAFNQLSVVNPDIGTDRAFDHVGGLGIHIVKQIMSEYAYDRINGRNVLVLKKRF